jgi:hypothetical protein
MVQEECVIGSSITCFNGMVVKKHVSFEMRCTYRNLHIA